MRKDRLDRVEKGFTLIEMVMAIVVLSMTVSMFSKGMHYLSEQSVSPVITLQASWIARSYLDEIQAGVGDRLSWCDPGEHSSMSGYRRMSGYSSMAAEGAVDADRRVYRSLCDYLSVGPTVVTAVTGESIAHLKDYRIQVELTPVHSHDVFLNSDAVPVNGLLAVATVDHPAIQSVRLNTWLWER